MSRLPKPRVRKDDRDSWLPQACWIEINRHELEAIQELLKGGLIKKQMLITSLDAAHAAAIADKAIADMISSADFHP